MSGGLLQIIMGFLAGMGKGKGKNQLQQPQQQPSFSRRR
jgi:hypothetical protein